MAMEDLPPQHQPGDLSPGRFPQGRYPPARLAHGRLPPVAKSSSAPQPETAAPTPPVVRQKEPLAVPRGLAPRPVKLRCTSEALMKPRRQMAVADTRRQQEILEHAVRRLDADRPPLPTITMTQDRLGDAIDEYKRNARKVPWTHRY